MNGGVASVSCSAKLQFFFAAGHDGSVFVVGVDEDGPDYPTEAKRGSLEGNEVINSMKTQELKPACEMMLFTDIMKEEFEKANQARKEEFRQEMMQKLGHLQGKLKDLLSENENVTDIERLERQEFCIDVERENSTRTQGEKWCQEIKEESDKKCLVLELLRERVIESTWNKMTVQSKAIKSISTDTLLHNFSLRKRTPMEEKCMRFAFNKRVLELTEKYQRIEAAIKECLDELEYSKSKEGYFMNRMCGKPDFMDNDAIAKASEEFALKEAEKKARKNADEMAKQATNK